MSTGRNEPCPCGSGKKYKRCCADKPAARPPDSVPGFDPDKVRWASDEDDPTPAPADPCVCGSGKQYRRCCKAQAERMIAKGKQDIRTRSRDAIHEAGHAVADAVLGLPFLYASLAYRVATAKGPDPTARYLSVYVVGVVRSDEMKRPRREACERGEVIDDEVTAAAAGAAAELLLFPGATIEEADDGAGMDMTPIKIAMRGNAKRIQRVWQSGFERAGQLIIRHRVAVAGVAEQLLRHERLTAAEVAALVECNPPQEEDDSPIAGYAVPKGWRPEASR